MVTQIRLAQRPLALTLDVHSPSLEETQVRRQAPQLVAMVLTPTQPARAQALLIWVEMLLLEQEQLEVQALQSTKGTVG